MHSSHLLTFKDEVKKLRANQNKTEKAEKLKGQLDKMSTDLEKVKHSKEEAEVSVVCVSIEFNLCIVVYNIYMY